MFERISTQVQKYILQPENSWIEKLRLHEQMVTDGLNDKMDVFFVV